MLHVHQEIPNQLLAKNSDGDQGEREQEQSKHAEAERRACLAGDREVGTQERRRGSTCTHERRGADGCCWVVVVGHHDGRRRR